jgi:hypothetical protein
VTGLSPGGDDESFALIHAKRGDRYTDQVGGLADGIEYLVTGVGIGWLFRKQWVPPKSVFMDTDFVPVHFPQNDRFNGVFSCTRS